jgi:membrane-associated protein
MTTDLSTLVLGWMASYGAPLVAGLLYLGALGIPLPATLVVIAGGAFIRQDLLDAVNTPLLGFSGTIAGDICLYLVGLLASGWIERRFGQTAAWGSARSLFQRRGGIAIYLTRWLLTAVAFPITLIAGSSRHPFRKFILMDILGELTWFAIYGGLGYAFGSQWELISDFLSQFSGFILGAVVLAAGVVILLKTGKRRAAAPPSENSSAT